MSLDSVRSLDVGPSLECFFSGGGPFFCGFLLVEVHA